MKKEILGLNADNRNLITILVFILLLIFGPIEPYGLIYRTCYLIVIPVLLWLILRYFGSKWRMSKASNNYLTRFIFAVVACALLVSAYFSYIATTHIECTQNVRTRDGQECVGDYMTKPGGDKEGALVQIMLAGIAIWLAASKRTEDE